MSAGHNRDTDATAAQAKTHTPVAARILAAARELFRAPLPGPVTISLIAAWAELSVPTLRRYFDSIGTVRSVLLEEDTERLVMAGQTALASGRSKVDVVREVAAAYVDFIDGAEEQVGRLLHDAALHDEPEVRRAALRVTRSFFQPVARFLMSDSRMTSREFRALELVPRLVSIIDVVVRELLSSDGRVPRNHVADLVAQWMLRATRGDWRTADGARHYAARVEMDAVHLMAGHGSRRLFRPVAPDDALAIPVSVYLDSAEDAEEVERAVRELLDAVGLEVAGERSPVIGSWFKVMIARLKQDAATTEVTDVLSRVERALEMRVLHKPQAEIDGASAEAVAKLITALAGQENAFIQIGSIFLIKTNGVVVVRNLSQRELAFLQHNSRLLDSPKKVLSALDEFAATSEPVLREG